MIAPGIGTKVTWECVHFGTLIEGRKEAAICKERGLDTVHVDLSGIREQDALLTRIAAGLNFPDYFGMNWNALIDCLRDLSWLNPKGVIVVLENSRDLWGQPTLAGSLIEVWLLCAESWARDDVPFHLAFTWD
jgi:RNAse (barnase) inhibitor barstar